jgi:hypothetical protein
MVVSRLLAFCRRLFRISSTGSTVITADNAAPLRPTTNASVPAPITATERISRFILDKNHFKPNQAFRAFEPPSNETVLSVSRTQNLAEAEVWQHADAHVGGPSGRPVLGRGDFTRYAAREVHSGGFHLDIQPDEPPLLHANVTGYPPMEQKEIRRSLAQQLVAKAVSVGRA